MSLHRRFFAWALLAFAPFFLVPVQASATVFLSDLISTNGSLTVGNLVFSNFAYQFTGDMPSDAGVTVTPYINGAGDSGLQFQAAFLDFLGGPGSDADIEFTVSEIDPNSLISGATLTGNPSVVGGPGVAEVVETFLPTDTNLTLSIYAISPGGSKLVDSGLFGVAHPQVFVQKDILTFSAGPAGIPTLSYITQNFHETHHGIPEPSTLVLVIAGLTTCLVVRRFRRD